MIPEPIRRYLDLNKIHYTVRQHPRAISAQQLAHALHTSGHRVAKTVIVEVDGAPWIAVLSADREVDTRRLANELGAGSVRMAYEQDFDGLFQGCETGAEPPLGHLYGLPVVWDLSLVKNQSIIFRGGNHQEAIELDFTDFRRLERPTIAHFSVAPTQPRAKG
jgi:Ala-tRNA(Pro) deacylase